MSAITVVLKISKPLTEGKRPAHMVRVAEDEAMAARAREPEDQSRQTVWHAEWYSCGINLSVVCMIGQADVTRYVNARVFTRRHLR